MINQKGIQVRKENGLTLLDVSHKEGITSFVYPPKRVFGQAFKENLKQPIMAQNASLLYAAWQSPEEEYSKEVINTFRGGVACFNGILYFPKEGAYIKNRPKISEGRVIMDKLDLVERLEANDLDVRFVPFGYKVGEQNAEELEKNPLVIALAGEEGAQNLAEISRHYKLSPFLFSFNSVDKSELRMSMLDSYRRLDVDGDCLGFGYINMAFEIFRK